MTVELPLAVLTRCSVVCALSASLSLLCFLGGFSVTFGYGLASVFCICIIYIFFILNKNKASMGFKALFHRQNFVLSLSLELRS